MTDDFRVRGGRMTPGGTNTSAVPPPPPAAPNSPRRPVHSQVICVLDAIVQFAVHMLNPASQETPDDVLAQLDAEMNGSHGTGVSAKPDHASPAPVRSPRQMDGECSES